MNAVTLLRLEGEVFLVVLSPTLAYRMVTGRINLGRLLARKDGREQRPTMQLVKGDP
jgi:hypothetical protein